MLKFQIDQVAIAPANKEKALELLRAMGATDWVKDHVMAHGFVFDWAAENEAELNFNYQMFTGVDGRPTEFEVLNYTAGENWVHQGDRENSVSHLGMHCSEEDLERWRIFFAEREISVAQEVWTDSHTNKYIAGKRQYHYAIFDTKAILGVDLKFIVRRMINEG